MQVGDFVHVHYIPLDTAPNARRAASRSAVVQSHDIYKKLSCVRCMVLEIQPDRCQVQPLSSGGFAYELANYQASLRPTQLPVRTATWVPTEYLSSEFQVHDSVILHSLVNQPHYNGKRGVLTRRDDTSHRWHFRTAMGFELSIKEGNLSSTLHIGLSVIVHRLANGDGVPRTEGFIKNRRNDGKYNVTLVVYNANGERQQGDVVVRREGMVSWPTHNSRAWIDNKDHPHNALRVRVLTYRRAQCKWTVEPLAEIAGVPTMFDVASRYLQTPLEKIQSNALSIQQNLRRHLPSENHMATIFRNLLEKNGHNFEDIKQLCIPSWQDDVFINLAADLDICNTCSKFIEKGIAREQCEGCTLFTYCGTYCKNIHWNDTHMFECQKLQQDMSQVHANSEIFGTRPTKKEGLKVSIVTNTMFMIMSTSSNFDNLAPYSGEKSDSSYINKYLRALKKYNKDLVWTFVPFFSLYSTHFMPVPLTVFAQFYEGAANHKEEEKFQVLEALCRKSVYIPTIITQKSEGGSFNMLDLIEYDTAVFFEGRL